MSTMFLTNDNVMNENYKTKIFYGLNQGKSIEKLSKTNEKARQGFFYENNFKEDEVQRSHNIILNEVK